MQVPLDTMNISLWSQTLAERALAWGEARLLSEINGQQPTASADNYLLLLASAMSKNSASSSVLLDNTVHAWMVSSGEFHGLDEDVALRNRSFMRNSSLLLAANRLGRMDVFSEAALQRLFAYQHRCGGFFNMDPGQKHGVIEAFTTAWGGRIALRLGWFAEATKAAHLLAEMLFMQPDPEQRFYFCYDSERSAVLTRWQPEIPQARYLDFGSAAGETHQIGLVLSFLAEMMLCQPAANWQKPLESYLKLLSFWRPSMLALPAMATVLEGLCIAAYSLGKAGEQATALLPAAVASVGAALRSDGSHPGNYCGLTSAYERGYSANEATGLAAICLRGAATVLASVDL